MIAATDETIVERERVLTRFLDACFAVGCVKLGVGVAHRLMFHIPPESIDTLQFLEAWAIELEAEADTDPSRVSHHGLIIDGRQV